MDRCIDLEIVDKVRLLMEENDGDEIVVAMFEDNLVDGMKVPLDVDGGGDAVAVAVVAAGAGGDSNWRMWAENWLVTVSDTEEK